MDMRSLDPVTFEVLRHRVEEIVHEMYYTMAVVSGNPTIFEVGDHEEAVLDSTGETVIVGGGIVEWVYALEAGARFLVGNYEENPGINEGDQFILNDVYTACVHAMDVEILAPVFWEGKRVAWVVSAGHHMDVGGMTPSSWCPDATEALQEALLMPGLKIVEKGVVRRDVEELIKIMTRTPEFNLLDIRSKIAANNRAISRLHETIQHWGIDTVLSFFSKIKDFSEEKVRAKLRELPDGKWSTVHYIESLREDYLKIQASIIKENEEITIDFSGSSPVSKGSQNLSKMGTISNALCAYLTMLCYDIPWSAGVWRPVRWVIPEGSWLNPIGRPATSYNTPCGGGNVTIGAVGQALAKMLLSSEKYRDEAYASSMLEGAGIVAGLTRENVPFSVGLMEMILVGMGALANKDGKDTGYNVHTPKTQIANIETNEQLFPWLYLYRREITDGGGPGKYRGGVGLEQALIPWKSPTETLFYLSIGMGDTIRANTGLAGGYPGPTKPWGIIKDSDILEKFRQGKAVRHPDEINGEREIRPPFTSYNLRRNDVLFHVVTTGGGGFGDPMKRDPQKVLKDVKYAYVSASGAREHYGVVIDAEKLQLNLVETDRLRRETIRKRLSDKESPLSPDEDGKIPQKARNARIFEGLEVTEISGNKLFQCSVCKYPLGPVNENSKAHMLKHDVPHSKGQQAHLKTCDLFVLREYCCPGCGTLLEVDTVLRVDPQDVPSVLLYN
jgi:N-methylhydantoinase B